MQHARRLPRRVNQLVSRFAQGGLRRSPKEFMSQSTTCMTWKSTSLLPSPMAPSTPSASGMQLTWQEVWTTMRCCAMLRISTHPSALSPATLGLHAPVMGGALTGGRQGRRERRSEWCGCSAGSLWDLRSAAAGRTQTEKVQHPDPCGRALQRA